MSVEEKKKMVKTRKPLGSLAGLMNVSGEETLRKQSANGADASPAPYEPYVRETRGSVEGFDPGARGCFYSFIYFVFGGT